MKELIAKAIEQALSELGLEKVSFVVEHPGDLSHGHYSTNVALSASKSAKLSPRVVAEKVTALLKSYSLEGVEKIEIAGPGFINVTLSTAYISEVIRNNLNSKSVTPLHTDFYHGKKIFFEYTQPNPFKEFHIGHLMNNVIGESLSRLIENAGGIVKRATYHGDVGIHVAKTLWALMKKSSLPSSVNELGSAYAEGNEAYETDAEAKNAIVALNKKIYEKTDEHVTKLYDLGRKISLDYFEDIYKRFGSHFDYHFYESESGVVGQKIVLEFLSKGVFEKSDGAVVFPESKSGLHTRVFLNSEGLPTYEAKEIGLAYLKRKVYPYDYSVTVTANEQDSFFKVVEKAIEVVFPDCVGKLKHVSHGLLKLPTGKMSSRTGTVISAESLISTLKEKVKEKIKDRGFDLEESDDVSEKVALSAIRFSILRQEVGGDVIFDFDKSISFEGDSGPYLQYSLVRARSVLLKAQGHEYKDYAQAVSSSHDESTRTLQTYCLRALDCSALLSATRDLSSHHLISLVLDLSSAFNAFYAHNKIIDPEKRVIFTDRIELVSLFSHILEQNLYLLGIETLNKM